MRFRCPQSHGKKQDQLIELQSLQAVAYSAMSTVKEEFILEEFSLRLRLALSIWLNPDLNANQLLHPQLHYSDRKVLLRFATTLEPPVLLACRPLQVYVVDRRPP